MEKDSTTIELPLAGVHSEHCALIVDQQLSHLPGIKRHHVEFNNEKAIIELDEQTSTLADVVNSIRESGYDVAAIKKSFQITGMSCASCAISVESMLKTERGVIQASVNYANNSAQVEFIPGITDLKHVKGDIQSIGYDIEIERSGDEGFKEEAQQQRYRALRAKTIWSIILSIPVVTIGMFFMNIPYANWIMMALTLPVIGWFGRSFYLNAFKLLRHGKTNMDTLVAMSTGIAFLFSLFSTVYPAFWHHRGLHPHVYFESASVVIAFIFLGKMLEEKAKSSTSAALKKLISLQPKTVTIIHEGGHEMEVPVAQVKTGYKIRIKPGDKIPVDGLVFSGSSFIDESTITGEPVPVEKVSGSKVFSGTLNQRGSLEIIAEKVGSETILAQIVKMVEQAQGSKAPVQKQVDKIAGIFVPVVIGISIVSFFMWLALGGENNVTQGILAAVTVLVVACPCALGLATPTAIMVGVGKGAENGILIKDAESLEKLRQIDILILDKTGTITQGKPEVTDINWNTAPYDARLINILFSAETLSEHPLAEAVVRYLAGLNAQKETIDHFESISGKGIRVKVGTDHYLVGTRTLLQEEGVSISERLLNLSLGRQHEAKTVIFFSKNMKAEAIIAIADPIKPTSAEAVMILQQNGIDVMMVTGDNAETAKAIAAQTSIRQFKANALPSEKASLIHELQKDGKIVGMAGDGVNDSQALAQADVSIAMGRGSDIARDVASITLISSDLRLISKAIRLSHVTVNTIRENLFWASVYNIIAIPLAAGILYPINGYLMNPMIAGAAMALSSVSVVTNSLRLKIKSLN